MRTDVIITPKEVVALMTANEYPPFVTVTRVYDRFRAMVMTWDTIHERYELSPNYIPGKFHKMRTDALIDAEFMAKLHVLEIRL